MKIKKMIAKWSTAVVFVVSLASPGVKPISLARAQGDVPPASTNAPSTNVPSTNAPSARVILRVYVRSQDDVRRLISGAWDVLESRGPDYLLVLGDDAVASALRAQGYTVEVDQVAEPLGTRAPFTFYDGYRTVVEHYQHLADVAAAHPDLATVIDYGDSWRKTNGRPNGYDLKAICITRLRPGDCALNPHTDKARFLLIAATHARELSTSEMAWRWIDWLVSNYNVDPDITWLLDYGEMWVVPVVNPDGRQIVETSNLYQRKNANTTWCPSGSFGVDLNRNASYAWGGIGSSGDACDETYRGPSPASEPEETALETLMSQLFLPQRGSLDADPAPITATGTMLTLHSYGNLALLPWGNTDCSGAACPPALRTPNDAQLRSFAFRMSYFNNYNTGQGSELLYVTSGSSDDWAYAALGIPAFTFEIGPDAGACPGFFPLYACQDSTFWPLNRGAFLYAARVARQPYMNAVGPTTLTPILTPTGVITPGQPLTITAVIDDGRYGANGFSRPTAQPITQAEYYIDTPPWAGGRPITMTAQDGAFNATVETARAVVDSCNLASGRHTLYVRGKDAGGNWGPVSAKWITATAATACSVTSATVTGPGIGFTGVGYTFTISVGPPTAVQPVTYTWQAIGHSTLTHTTGLSDTAVFSWPVNGRRTITATAANSTGGVTATFAISILAPMTFLPLALR